MKKILLICVAALFLATLISFAISYARLPPQGLIVPSKPPSKGYVTCAIARYCLGHDGRWIDTLKEDQ